MVFPPVAGPNDTPPTNAHLATINTPQGPCHIDRLTYFNGDVLIRIRTTSLSPAFTQEIYFTLLVAKRIAQAIANL